jgi:manganese/zinc/iron transport system substrate-binding protein
MNRLPCLVTLLLFAGCSSSTDQPAVGSSHSLAGKVTVLATTGMIADAARIVGGDHAEVMALMGPGVDPHLYQPTARDQGKLKTAQLIFYNGLHLEGKMVEIFESLAKQKRVVAVSSGISESRLLSWKASAGMHDPHIWFDVKLWQEAVRTIAQAYVEADPPHAPDYERRSSDYLAELDRLDQYCRDRAAELADDERVLITSHDAFHYFGRAYGFEVIGIQGISTDSEAGLKAITDAVDLIRMRHIRAIFPETSVSRAAIERVAKDSQAELGPELYSDALGAPDSSAGNYVGMIRTNIDNIVNSLKAR